MLNDNEARVPFAVIGVLLVIVATIVSVYLMSAESQGVAGGIGDDRERDLSRALTLAASDIGSALDYAGLSAEAEAGKAPIINASINNALSSNDSSIDDERIKYIAWHLLTQYLESDYNGSFTYGDYSVDATLAGDYRSMAIIPDNMTLGRKFDSPVAGCQDIYATYYSMSVPVRLTVREAGSNFTYSEVRTIRSLITARYPLLRQMTAEYERRLNGTPMTFDLTAAAFAYTWTRGYEQYAAGTPLNIVDNGQQELIANGAVLLEQGFEYNSVDPLGLAALVSHCVGNGTPPAEVNSYDIASNSREGLPQDSAAPPESYSFNIDAMADRAYDNVSFGGYAENTLDGAYTVCMCVDIERTKDYYPLVNETCVVEEQSEPGPSAVPGGWLLLTRAFRVCRDNSDGKGYADRVTVSYILTRYSLLQYIGAGKLSDSSEDAGNPVLAGSADDVADPFSAYTYEKDLSFGHKVFTDENLQDAVRRYEASFDMDGGQDRFEKTLAAIIGDRDGWQARVPLAFTNPSYEFVCGLDNKHPAWAEIESDYELRDLCAEIKKEITVSLDPGSYGDSPAAMTQAAYATMDRLFEDSYDRYLDQSSYSYNTSSGYGSGGPVYKSCGAKAICRIRDAFLADLRTQLDDAADNASDMINRTIDERLNGTGMNASSLTAGATSAREYLAEHFYIPFGLAMGLNSSEDFALGYPWDENITLAVDQEPSYLDTGLHADALTGYTVRTLRLRNVCVFSLSADMSWTDSMADAIAEPVLAGVDAMSASAGRLANQTVTGEIDSLADSLSGKVRSTLGGEIASGFGESDSLDGVTDAGSIAGAVGRAFERRDNDPGQIIRDLRNGTLAIEIADDIAGGSAEALRERAVKVASGYEDEYMEYIRRTIEKTVADATHRAIVQATTGLKDQIRTAFEDFSRDAAQEIAVKGADATLEQALGKVPSGLPLLPPFGWWATMNVWYIEAQGVIPVFTVYDADAEQVPDPVFGGQAISYTRRHQIVTDSDGNVLGYDEPLRFTAKTGTFILVPPGPQGVGDKIGGQDEKSQGYDEPEAAP